MIRILSEYLEPRVRFTKHDVENIGCDVRLLHERSPESALEALKSAKNKHKNAKSR